MNEKKIKYKKIWLEKKAAEQYRQLSPFKCITTPTDCILIRTTCSQSA